MDEQHVPDVALAMVWVSVGWDRWDGSKGPWPDPERTASWYSLGGRALARRDDVTALMWLTRSVRNRHPGACFRLALVKLRADDDQTAHQWLIRAKAFGHGDALRILTEARACLVDGTFGSAAEERLLDALGDVPEDPAFAAEVALLFARTL
ncbi:hypothetical protein [Streptomyces sp. NPDC048603]|uniref:hypothetical protein n=1 Tax=Streptomyces sp. NPDC048603 TaxID=3365577 RepID=UPI00371613DE